jgi:16S rRNA (guanine966-N2)-methyltransferase
VRIVAGEWRGRRLAVPPGEVRPTADKVREAWMSIMQRWLPEARVVDLCAGSGALGLEALSRGAAHATLVEQDPRVRRVLHENITTLGATDRVTVVGEDAVRFVRGLAPGTFDLALADPPYASEVADALVTQWLAQPFAARLAVEHAARHVLPGAGETRRYGTTAITFYHHADPTD